MPPPCACYRRLQHARAEIARTMPATDVLCTGSSLKKADQRHSERSEESLFEQKSKGKEGFLTPRTPPACRGLVRDDAQFFANLLVS